MHKQKKPLKIGELRLKEFRNMKTLKNWWETSEIAYCLQMFLDVVVGIAFIAFCTVAAILLIILSVGVVVLGSAYIVQGIKFFLE